MRRTIAVVSTLALIVLAGAFAVPVAQAGDPCFHDLSRPAVTDGRGSTVKIEGCVFLPTIARVPVGATVRFINSGDQDHMVTGANLAWGISGDKRLAPGDELTQTFEAEGVYPFTCLLHPGMTGAIVVGSGGASTGGGAGAVTAAPAAPVVSVAGGAQTPAADGAGPLPLAAAVVAVLLALFGSIAWLGRRRGAVPRAETR